MRTVFGSGRLGTMRSTSLASGVMNQMKTSALPTLKSV
jgi:hypothetical protein